MEILETLEVIPDPVSLIESMRAVGYTLEAAVADIVDNSLSADAARIHVKYDAVEKPFVAILDDGFGMSPDELTNAMRHGSSNPADRRAIGDLGRFGLGLKTASLSQCRRLTVISKKGGIVSSRRWDLDVVAQLGAWAVVVPQPSELRALPMYARLENQTSGTLVIWEDLDRMIAGAKDPAAEMTAKMGPLFEHLALVFHRFTSGDSSNAAIEITVNSLRLPARDPFLGTNHFRQALEGQVIRHERGSVSVVPYILPPVHNLTPEQISVAGGREGLRGTQGFYVYRGRRLVIWGTWFRLVPKDEFYKLTRVQVDIPNSFDDLWALDIKKSAAYPPDVIRDRLRQLIPHFAGVSKKTITFKGRRAKSAVADPLWTRSELPGRRVAYTPNVDHPLLMQIAEAIPRDKQSSFQILLDLLGRSLPIESIYADMSSDDVQSTDPALASELSLIASQLMSISGMTLDQILEMDPFVHHMSLHEHMRREIENV
ncbi:ATP-binding protein [Bacillus sp. NP157]|nr:ATP-binding protein [Bacillus sp. NP157]